MGAVALGNGGNYYRQLLPNAGASIRSIAPFPIPAHQTRRADFPHRAFRLALPEGTRRLSRNVVPRGGIHNFTFDACSRFTRVAVCRFAASQNADSCHRRFSRKVSLLHCPGSDPDEPTISEAKLPSAGILSLTWRTNIMCLVRCD